MMTAESQHLLAEYVASGSERAFQELVARYVDLVYSTALRLVEGDSHRAQDVAQTVFVDLARLAPRLSPNTMLGGWLHRHTCFVARTLMRGERRRQARERQAVEMSALDNHPDAALAEVAAVLDEAIHELGPDDRDAILLRFFEHRNLRAVGEALGLNENVAQKRVARAVQELAGLLRRRGFTLSAAALAAALGTGAVQAAPAGLALALAQAALAGAGTTGGTAATAAKLALVTKLKVGLAGVLIVAGLGTMVWLQFPSHARLQDEPQLAQSPPADLPAPESPDLPAPTADPLPASPPPAAALVSPPSAAPAPAAQAGLVADAPPTPPAATLPPPAFPPGDFVHRFVSRSGSRLRIDGTSTLGKWQVQSTILQGFLEIEPTWVTNLAQLSLPAPLAARAEVLVPVTSLKSLAPNGMPFSDAMDNVIYQHLLGADGAQKKLRFQLTRLTLQSRPDTTNNTFWFQAQGKLAVAGITHPLALPVSLSPQPNGQWQLSGTFALRMSSFGINSAALTDPTGRLTPGDVVRIQFDWRVAPQNRALPLAHQDWLPLLLDLPAPDYKGIPPDFPGAPLVEPVSATPRPPLLVPPGLTNLARAARITSSDKNAAPAVLATIIDGNKRANTAVFLRKGVQWVQLDLSSPCEIYAIVLWHAHDAAKVYHDVVVQLADDPGCQEAVQTLFNNDRTNALGLGAGTDREYVETYEGKLVDAHGATGQYLRFYSKGSTQSALNEYTEIEVYGRRVISPACAQ